MIRLAAFADEAAKELDGQIRALKRNGIGMIELRGIDGRNICRIPEKDAEGYAARLKEAGIAVWSMGSPIGKIALAGDREKHLGELRHVCQLARIFGTDRIRVFSFFEAYGAEETVIARLKEMTAVAAEVGCTLCHENEKQIFGDTCQRVERIMDSVPGMSFVYDPANFVEVGEDCAAAAARLSGRCDYFHIKDCLAATGEIVPAGLGDGRIPELIGSVAPERDITLTLEPHLAIFEGYSEIDRTRLKTRYRFRSSDEAFDAAAAALKKVLTDGGWKETEGGFTKA